MPPSISVTMCLFNSLPYIDETIQSLLAQTWNDFEAILVDDGSTDGTAEHIVKRYPDQRLKIIRQANAGMGPARSVSVSHAQGDYVAFLDHDDVWLPNKLERQMKVASEHPEASLIFSNSLLIDSEGRVLGTVSDRYDYLHFDLRAGYAHDELLHRGCFVTMSTAMVKLSELRKFGRPDPEFRYGDDYDMWLCLSRNCPIVYIDEILAKWRIHNASITERHPEFSVRGHNRIWGPIINNHTYPLHLRVTVADHLFGQQRCAIRQLIHQHRFLHVARVASEMLKEPESIIRFTKHNISQTDIGKNCFFLIRFLWNLFLHARDFVWMAPRRIRERSWFLKNVERTKIHIWVDGTSLKAMQTGYFNFVCETIRLLAKKEGFIVHVTVPSGGSSILFDRLGVDASNLKFHIAGSELRGLKGSSNWFTNSAKYVMRILPRVRRQSPKNEAVEVMIWRRRFQFDNSLKIAVIHDITPRLLPEFHTHENVTEFDEYVEYVRRNADLIVTVSEQSRKDIVEHLEVRPNSVRIVQSQIHPVYIKPKFNRHFLAHEHLIHQRYLLCVGTIEPRKNLRRVVEAFVMLRKAGALRKHILVIAGPQGWDDTFDQFINDSRGHSCILKLGFVRLEHMPSLYHFASAFIYPSIYEGFGLPVLEAMCSSANVLTSNVTSLAEIAGDVIKTFDPHDTMSIVEAILTATTMIRKSEVAYRKQCRKRGKQLLCESYERPTIATLIAKQAQEENCTLPSHSQILI